MSYSKQALDLAKKLNDDQLISKAHYQVGTAYWSIGELVEAMEELQISLSFLDAELNPELTCRIYLRLGAIYAANGEHTKAIYYYNVAIPYFDRVHNNFIKHGIYNNIGKALLDIELLDSARRYFDLAFEYEDKIPERFMPILLFNMADLNYQQKNIEESKKFLFLCDSLSKIHNDRRSQIRVGQLTAEILLQENQVEMGLEQIENVNTLAQGTGVRELLAITNETYSRVLERSGKVEEALKALRASHLYYDSIQSKKAKNKLELFIFDEAEKEKEDLRMLQQIAELKAANQKQLTIIAAVIAILMLIIAWTNYRSRKLIKDQNDDLQTKNKLIEKQSEQLGDLSVFKTKVMGVMAHDVKSPIQNIFGIIDLLDNQMMTNEDLQKLLPHVSDQLSKVNVLLNNIFEWSRASLDDESVKPELFRLHEMAASSVEEHTTAVDAKGVVIKNLISSEIKAYADPNMIKVVIRNLLNNAIKYSKENGNISLEASQSGNTTTFSIADEGVGMTDETIKKLFSYGTKSEIGTANEIGSGFGLIVCKDFVEMNLGDISVKSEPNRGTVFTVELPSS
ncbi:MAG: tetratricopeptide repeat-containing sensor histidine kinase [Cyclobacteriaceae bacterium]